MSFALHTQLEKNTAFVCDLAVCRVLLMNDARFPWLILVPRREGMRELFDLAPGDYAAAMDEVRRVSQAFAQHTGAHKINVAALGNMVPQLHIHIIARFPQDCAWPAPIWSAKTGAEPYETATLAAKMQEIRGLLQA